jgi:AraC-like DNA-binding protein
MTPRVPGTMSALLFLQKVEALAGLGLDTARILGLAGLPRERLIDPHGRLPADASFSFWDAAIRVSGDPAIGLKVGEGLRTGALGSFEYLLRNSETVEQTVERADRFMRLVDDTARLELRKDERVAALRIYRMGGYPFPPSDVEALFSAAASIYRKALAGAAFPAVHVRFTHAAPADDRLYAEYFGCPVAFGSDGNELQFPAALLEQRAPGADPSLGLVLEEYTAHLVAQLPTGDPLVSAARGQLLDELKSGAPSPASVARALHMSERTLRRRLQADGTSYQALLEGLREQLAREYVVHTRDGFEAVAQRLAFRDASTFFRAFKRWTGVTPAQYRATHTSARR